MTLMPKESGKLIASLSKNVFIEEEGVKHVACAALESLKDYNVQANHFSQHKFHPNPEDPRAADWIFVLDTLNYSFWTATGKKKWTVCGETGYFALCAAIKRALDEGKPIVDPKYYSEISRSEVEYIFRGDDKEVVIPLLDERVKSLQQTGKVLLTKYKGSFVEVIKSCANSAESLLKLIVNEFESYRDEVNYQNHRVSIYKRAQILIGDIWACFKGEGIGKFHDIECITMFADYRIPQVLVHFGALRYSDSLMSKLHADQELEYGSEEEVEIRGCSIEVTERITEEVKALIRKNPNVTVKESDVNAIVIDHFLWDYRRHNAAELEKIPFHKTRCIYY